MFREGAMRSSIPAEAVSRVVSNRRKFAPRVCVADGKRHIRAFLAEALEELGFVACECAQADDVEALLDEQVPELMVIASFKSVCITPFPIRAVSRAYAN